jgi:hypothetical protein
MGVYSTGKNPQYVTLYAIEKGSLCYILPEHSVSFAHCTITYDIVSGVQNSEITAKTLSKLMYNMRISYENTKCITSLERTTL